MRFLLVLTYCQAHMFDTDDRPLVRIFAALKSHLNKARGKNDGTIFDIFDIVDPTQRKRKLAHLQHLQRQLNNWGATEGALKAYV